MAVVTITISESSVQLISGIPISISMTTNIPSTIFYTLDGTDPTTSSSVYIGGELELPTNQTTVVFKVFATDGVDSSSIITRTYQPDIVILRQAQDEVDMTTEGPGTLPMFPYGDPTPTLPVVYGNIAEPPVDAPDVPGIPDGFDGTGTGTYANETDEPITSYEIKYSDSNVLGERGHGIGTRPAEVIIDDPQTEYRPEFSNPKDRFFNPKALVIYQDSRDEPFDEGTSIINRQYFSLENPEIVKDGILEDTTAYEGLTVTGSLVRTYFNPNDNTMTYYYFDSQVLRWIISTEPYTPNRETSILTGLVFSSRNQGDQHVYKWRPFAGRRLI